MSFKSQRVLLYITHRMRDSTLDMQTNSLVPQNIAKCSPSTAHCRKNKPRIKIQISFYLVYDLLFFFHRAMEYLSDTKCQS